MAAIHLIHTNRHRLHPSFQKVYDPLKKVVLEVLFSNEYTSRSGIYSIATSELSSRVACAALDNEGKPIYDEDDCLQLIEGAELKKIVKKLETEDGVLRYDGKSHIVYLYDFLEAVPFGLSASLIADALCAEYKNYRMEEYWKDFFYKNGKHILEYINTAEKETERKKLKYIKDFIENPKNKGKTAPKIEDFKDDITTPNMAILKGLIKTMGYDEEKIILIKNYKH